MAKIRPNILIRYGRQNEPLRVPIFDLLQDAVKSFLIDDYAVGSSSVDVQKIYGFGINQIVFIGKIGVETSEIIKTSASVAPSGNTVTLDSNTTQPHSNSDYVYIIPYDQVEFSSAATLTGTKTVLTTVNLDVASETKYNDTTLTSGYYFARFKNSITSVYSDYSDGVPVGSYAQLSARYLIDSALKEINKTTSDLFSDEYGFMQINNCQMEVLRELKRWSWMQVFNATYPTYEGNWRVPVPSDLDDPNTNKSIYSFRVGNDQPMTWVDKGEWDNIVYDVSYSQLLTALGVGDATVILNNSSDFEDSGTIQIGSDSLSYTANDKTTGILTLSSVSTVAYAADKDVFQNSSMGTPTYWTTFAGYLWHYPVTDSNHDSMNYSLDYYSTLTPIASDTDTIVVPDPILVINYLKWKYLTRMNSGKEDDSSQMAYKNFILRKAKLKQTEVLNTKIVLKPRYNNYFSMEQNDGDSKYVRTQGFIPNL